MKQSIGGTYLIYFISIFILIVFAFLCGIINYMKAFKVNSAIANALENYEGYNSLSRTEIDRKLGTIGYRKSSSVTCKTRNVSGKNYSVVDDMNLLGYDVCIYEIDAKVSESECRDMLSDALGIGGSSGITLEEAGQCKFDKVMASFKYGIITYIYIDLPMINELRIPIYSETEKIYDFSK